MRGTNKKSSRKQKRPFSILQGVAFFDEGIGGDRKQGGGRTRHKQIYEVDHHADDAPLVPELAAAFKLKP